LYNFTTLGGQRGRNRPRSALRVTEVSGLQDVQVNKGMQEWRVPFTVRFRVEACGHLAEKGLMGQ
ncbi:hypothetical protein OS493_039897, partial [Desmophyllum pertusum]